MATDTPHYAEMAEAELGAAIKSRGSSPLLAVGAFKELARRRSPALVAMARSRLTSATAPVPLRNAAAVALGGTAGAENQSALLKALSPTAPALTKHVAHALGRIGDKRALAKLEALPTPPLPSDAAAVSFAKSLIAYRLRLGVHQITPAAPSKRLLPDAAQAIQLAVSPPKAALRKAILTQLQAEAPGIALSDVGALAFTCRTSQFVIVMTKDYAEAPDLAHFAKAGGVIAVVFKQADCAEESAFSLDEYLFVNPAKGNAAALIGARASGETAHSGEIALDPGGSFTLAAENSVFSQPLSLKGSLNHAGKLAALDNILVSPGGTAGQRTPGRPKPLALAAKAPPRAQV